MRRATIAAAAAGLAILTAPAAAADPPPQPPGVATCNGQAVPLDPRVSVANPVGTLIFQAFLNAMCGPPPMIGAGQ